MRSAAIGMAVLALVAMGAPEAAASDKSHDGGFFLRLGLGGGYASTEVDDGLGALEIRGLTGSFDVAIGAVVAKNFAVHGTLGGFDLAEPTVEFRGLEEDTDDDARDHGHDRRGLHLFLRRLERVRDRVRGRRRADARTSTVTTRSRIRGSRRRWASGRNGGSATSGDSAPR